MVTISDTDSAITTAKKIIYAEKTGVPGLSQFSVQEIGELAGYLRVYYETHSKDRR